VLLALSPHDLTALPEVVGVGLGAGLVLGGIVGLFWQADDDAALVQNVVAGGTIGSIIGTAFGFVISLAMIVAGA
jgi:hypothetical protein